MFYFDNLGQINFFANVFANVKTKITDTLSKCMFNDNIVLVDSKNIKMLKFSVCLSNILD